MKKIFLIITVCLLAACSTTEYNYTNKELRKNVSLPQDKLSISKFNLILNERRINSFTSADNTNSEYLNTDKMKKLMESSIISNLKSDGVYADNNNGAYKYEVSLDASRNFMAFSDNKYAGLQIHNIDIKVFKDGNLFAEKSLAGGNKEIGVKGLLNNSGPSINCGHNRGFVSNLETIAKTITAQKGNIDEIKDVEYCSVAISNTIKKLGE